MNKYQADKVQKNQAQQALKQQKLAERQQKNQQKDLPAAQEEQP